MLVWRKFKAFHGTSISKRRHRGCRRLPFSRMTMVNLTYLWKKCTLNAVLVASCPLHPSNGNSCIPTAVGNDIRNVCESPSRGGGILLLSPSHVHTMLSLSMHGQRPRFQVLTPVRPMHHYPLSGPVGESLTSRMLLVRCFWLDLSRATVAEDHPNRLPNVCMKTHLPVRVTNSPCNHTGSVDATRPSPAYKKSSLV